MKPTPARQFGALNRNAIVFVVSIGILSSAVISLAATYVVDNTSDSGAGSLRQAILDANAQTGSDEIQFNIDGAGPHTITPATALPIITDPVVIDGYTQPGANVNALANGTNAVLKIELSGELLSNRETGLTLETSDSTIRGLVVNRFPEYGITVGKIFEFENDNNVLEGNFVGTNVDGTATAPNGSGVSCVSTQNSLVGGTSPAARNLISGNKFWGVSIAAANCSIQGNLIGTDAAVTAALPNRDGITVSTGGGFDIGGTVPGAGNIIAGNTESGIVFSAVTVRGVKIRGNAIGTDFSGTLNLQTQFFGIQIHAGWNNVIGGEDGANIIAYNTSSALRLSSTDAMNNSVRGNRIFNNGWLAVQLVAPSGSENDPCDTDFGPNGAQNTPQLTSSNWSAGQMTLEGTLNSTAETTFALDFYATTSTGSGEYPQGEYYIGASELTTNAGCEGTFSISLPVPAEVPGGTVYITATATDPQGSTSTYSSAIEVTGGGVVVTDADGDGLPAGWETNNGLNDDDASGDNGADGDPDRDRSSNLAEYLAGTDPNNANSVLRITHIDRQGNDIRVTWNTVGGRTNQLQASTDLIDFVDVGSAINVPGSGDVSANTIDPNALTNASGQLYRIRVVH